MSPAPLSLRLTTNSPPHGPMVTRRRERRGRRAPSPACLLSIALAAAVVRLADGQGGADSLTTAASEAVGSIDNVGFYFEGPKIFADTMNIPRSWNPDKKPNMIKPRSCDGTEELACEQAYMRCLLYEGPANDADAACYCAGQFYGKCLRAAGCAAKRYGDCWKEHFAQNCADMSVCGSNCVGDGNSLDLQDGRILPINNFAANFLRFSVCNLGVDEDVLERFEVVRMKRCAEPGPGVEAKDAFKICPYWIPPSTYTALVIPKNSTYIRLEYANYVDSRRIQPDITNGSRYFVANVLSSPPPIEVRAGVAWFVVALSLVGWLA